MTAMIGAKLGNIFPFIEGEIGAVKNFCGILGEFSHGREDRVDPPPLVEDVDTLPAERSLARRNLFGTNEPSMGEASTATSIPSQGASGSRKRSYSADMSHEDVVAMVKSEEKLRRVADELREAAVASAKIVHEKHTSYCKLKGLLSVKKAEASRFVAQATAAQDVEAEAEAALEQVRFAVGMAVDRHKGVVAHGSYELGWGEERAIENELAAAEEVLRSAKARAHQAAKTALRWKSDVTTTSQMLHEAGGAYAWASQATLDRQYKASRAEGRALRAREAVQNARGKGGVTGGSTAAATVNNRVGYDDDDDQVAPRAKRSRC